MSTGPLNRPKRKNPNQKTRLPLTPPAGRSRESAGLINASMDGEFRLQVCTACETVQYPPKQICAECLHHELQWRRVPNTGKLIAETTLAHSNDLYFKERLPHRLGTVQLDCGPSVVAHVLADVPKQAEVKLRILQDRSGHAVLVAQPLENSPHMHNDPIVRECICNPQFRKILIVDGRAPTTVALTKLLVKAEAHTVFIGRSRAWMPAPELDALAQQYDSVKIVDLDVEDNDSVSDLAKVIGGKVDILINNSHFIRMGGIAGKQGLHDARKEMEVGYFGLLRLAQHFAPTMRFRAAEKNDFGAVAWVNILSVYALINRAPFGTHSAAMAAAHSLSQCLRSEMQGAGIKVINLYPGPLDDDWEQLVPPPKLSPAALAKEVMTALMQGREELYPGPVAQEVRERLADNPKELERNMRW